MIKFQAVLCESKMKLTFHSIFLEALLLKVRQLFVEGTAGAAGSAGLKKDLEQGVAVQRSSKQALEAISKGVVNQNVHIGEGQNMEEMASKAEDLFGDLERMRGSSDGSDAEAEDEVDMREWSVRLSFAACSNFSVDKSIITCAGSLHPRCASSRRSASVMDSCSAGTVYILTSEYDYFNLHAFWSLNTTTAISWCEYDF